MQSGVKDDLKQEGRSPSGELSPGSRSSLFSLPSSVLSINALALLTAAVFLRFYALGTIPGFNGDEGWYGVRAWEMFRGGAGDWNTPTGNPLNPLFVGPLALLHLWLPPSLWLLRAAALASGIAALAINWLMCRWVFDRRTAAISTVVLAVLPIDIAYSRFAWDACQSLAATLPVVYFSLAAVRFPERFGRWIAAAILAQAVALWVHPTNVFVGAAIAAACAARLLARKPSARGGEFATQLFSGRRYDGLSALLLAVAGSAVLAWVLVAGGAKGAVWEQVARYSGNLRDAARASYLYPQLFTGGTVYRDIAGSRSWIEGRGIDVALFWACVLGSAWIIRMSFSRFREQGGGEERGEKSEERRAKSEERKDATYRLRFRRCDAVLLAAWAMTLAAFVVLAGPDALLPGQERFAVCLIGPTVLLVARGGALAWKAAAPKWRLALAFAALAGWPLLADFYVHYFRFIEQTGGQAHLTFRAAEVEPKQAALRYILADAARRGTEQNNPRELWIVASQWWICQPIRYLALGGHDVHVALPDEARSSVEYRRALADGDVWFVEFSGTKELRQVERELAGRHPTRQEFLDFGRRPVICVLHAEGVSGVVPH